MIACCSAAREIRNLWMKFLDFDDQKKSPRISMGLHEDSNCSVSFCRRVFGCCSAAVCCFLFYR